ncbi:MAG: HD-GYP domain-containing protein, partial [Nitrospirales bacterium]
MNWARQHRTSSRQRLIPVALPVTTALEALRRRDPCTFAHTDRVVRYAQLLGRVIGLSSQELGMLELGVRLHDIGKLFVPDRILHKPGPLSRAEWAVMR